MNYKLVKEIYFPSVKGSQFGIVKILDRIKSVFVNYQTNGEGDLKKTSNFSSTSYLGLPILYKVGYKLFGNEVAAVDKGNRYLRKQYKRMAKHLANKDIERYTAVFDILRYRSEFFLLVNFVKRIRFYPNNYSVTKCWKIIREVRALVNGNKVNLKFKRVYLPEYNSDGTIKKHRPLGVPSIEWRVVMSMYEFFLVNILESTWCKHQYACMPKRGVVDVWIQILTNYKDYKTIIGIDLAKFFDTVYIRWVSECMKAKGIPDKINTLLTSINYQVPKISKADIKLEKERIDKLNKEAPTIIYPEKDYSMRNRRSVSLPQGLNTSPILACLGLNQTYTIQTLNDLGALTLQYMDDGVIMGQGRYENLLNYYTHYTAPAITGITVSPSKTEVCKEHGKWLRPLKFLGCEFDGNTFRAHTRKNGVYEVKYADMKTQEIIAWLEQNRGNVQAYPRQLLSRYISQGWNKGDWAISDPNKDLTYWEKCRIIVTKVYKDSVEANVVMKYRKDPRFYHIIGSTNTMSMLCSGYLINTSKRNTASQIVEPWKETTRSYFVEISLMLVIIAAAISVIPKNWN